MFDGAHFLFEGSFKVEKQFFGTIKMFLESQEREKEEINLKYM